MRNPYVVRIDEKFGEVWLTAKELDVLREVVTSIGDPIGRTSTQYGVTEKIRDATGSRMKPIQLMCWFVYKHKIVGL